MIKVKKDYLKRIITEELNKELHNNRVPVISKVGLGLIKTTLLRFNYAFLDEVEKVNKEQNYNFTEEDCSKLVHFVIENIEKLLPNPVTEENDYEKEQIKRAMDSAKTQVDNVKRRKLAYDQKKNKEKMDKL